MKMFGDRIIHVIAEKDDFHTTKRRKNNIFVHYTTFEKPEKEFKLLCFSCQNTHINPFWQCGK